MAKDKVSAEAKADAPAEKNAKTETHAASEYVASGTLLHRMFNGKREFVYEGEPIPAKAKEIMVGIDKDQTLLDHWLERGIIMLKTDYDKAEAAKKAAAEKSKQELRR